MRYIGMCVAIVQFILHYLGIITFILGIIAFAFGNLGRAKELAIAGISWFILKYVIGAVYLLILNLVSSSRSTKER